MQWHAVAQLVDGRSAHAIRACAYIYHCSSRCILPKALGIQQPAKVSWQDRRKICNAKLQRYGKAI